MGLPGVGGQAHGADLLGREQGTGWGSRSELGLVRPRDGGKKGMHWSLGLGGVRAGEAGGRERAGLRERSRRSRGREVKT